MLVELGTLVDVAGEEDAGDEAVEDAREHQRHQVEDDQVGQIVAEVLLARQLEDAAFQRFQADVLERLRFGEAEPRHRIARGESPDAGDDLFGALHRADALRLHRMADGDVALDGERRQRQRRHVDAQILHEDEERAAETAPHPLVADDEVTQDLVRHRTQQHHAVGRRQTHLPNPRKPTQD